MGRFEKARKGQAFYAIQKKASKEPLVKDPSLKTSPHSMGTDILPDPCGCLMREKIYSVAVVLLFVVVVVLAWDNFRLRERKSPVLGGNILFE